MTDVSDVVTNINACHQCHSSYIIIFNNLHFYYYSNAEQTAD